GQTRSIDDVKPSDVGAVGYVDVVTDRVQLGQSQLARVRQGVERAWALGSGRSSVALPDAGLHTSLASGFSCPVCERSLTGPSPGLFSYESPLGACPRCRGFGRVIGVDLDKLIPDPYKTLAQRAIRPWSGKSSGWERRVLERFCVEQGIPT